MASSLLLLQQPEGGAVQQQRARRRPARYSPELSSNSAAQQQQTAQQQQSDMCFRAEVQRELANQEVHENQLLQGSPENEDHEETTATLSGQEMAPSTGRRGKYKQKRKYKRKNTNEDGTAKKPRVANVLLENEMLIDEIRTRKALWMRTHEQHHSSQMTGPMWEEIAKILDTTQENIRRRWKSLKDHYRRELKKSMTDATAPPSAWPYYKKMRFMKSQMFVSLRRKNGEDHLEILSDDEEELNGQWSSQRPQKQEGDSDTMDGYEMSEYNQLIKYEQHMQDLSQADLEATMDATMDGTMNATQEEEEDEEEEEEEHEQQEEEQDEQMQEHDEMSPIPSLQDQDELNALQQQQADLSELTNMSTMQQQTGLSTDMSTMTTMTNISGISNAIVTTTASSLNARLSHADLQQQTSDAINAMNRSGTLSTMQQPRNMNGNLSDMNARHSVLEQQHAEINGRLNAIQRNVEMSAIQQRANIAAMHQRAQNITLQQRAELQQRNSIDNGVDNSSGVSSILDRGGISDDYHFFMSLLPHVKNFTSLQKLKVRNRIQQIIIEEATTCQYDPLGNC